MQKSKIFIGIIILFISSAAFSQDIDNSTVSELENAGQSATFVQENEKKLPLHGLPLHGEPDEFIEMHPCKINPTLPVCPDSKKEEPKKRRWWQL